jgi:hypothetical protein
VFLRVICYGGPNDFIGTLVGQNETRGGFNGRESYVY